MYIAFNNMPPAARVWVYQADRALSEEEISFIRDSGRSFISNWKAHGEDLIGSLTLLHQHFVVLAVDQQSHAPSGCSIDESVGFIQNLERKLNVNFFDRKKVSLWKENSVLLIALDDIKSGIRQGTISQDDLMFNTVIQNKASLESWIIPLKNSWLGRYFKQKVR